MSRLIDADDFLDLFYVMAIGQDKAFIKAVEQVVSDTPTVDSVEVVRCCDCRHFRHSLTPDRYLPDGVKETECLLFHFGADYTGFCSYGERRADD